jgi:hypothetical protein
MASMTEINTPHPPVVRRVRASSAQEGRWRGSAFDVVNRVYRLRGPLDAAALHAAFADVTERHESLRCSLSEDGELFLRVHTDVPPPLTTIDAQGETVPEREAWLHTWLTAETTRPFDRETPPLMRATLVRMGPDDHVLAIVLDHIISDGWSVEVLAGELGNRYQAALGAEVPALDELFQYPDWVVEERAVRTEERLAARTDFWRDKLPEGPGDVAVWLSGYRDAGDAEPETTGLLETVLDKDLTEGLRRTARRLRVTLNVLTATVLIRLLQRDTGQERITLSTSSASRFSPDTASMIGYLATTIWIPSTLRGATDLPAAARGFQQDMHEVMAKADVPARHVFERLWGLSARSQMDALPQVGFLCTPFWGEALDLPGIDVAAEEFDDREADGTLSVYLTDRGSHIELQVRFFQETLVDGYAERLLAEYLADLSAAVAEHG